MKRSIILNEYDLLVKFVEKYNCKFLKVLPEEEKNKFSFLFVPDASEFKPEFLQTLCKKVNEGEPEEEFGSIVRRATLTLNDEKALLTPIEFTYPEYKSESMREMAEDINAFLLYIYPRYEDEVMGKATRAMFAINRRSKKIFDEDEKE